MSKLIIAKGLPGSGKSTISQGRILADGNTIRINKDLLRKMMHFGKFSGPNESLTRDAARELAKLFIGKGVNVIIDDTNLNPGTMQSWKDLAERLEVKVEIMDLTDVPIEDCIARDLGREESVGSIVIKNMAIKAGIKKFEKDSVCLIDIDGTIADITHRLHFVKPGKGHKKDWKGFFESMDEDEVREDVKKDVMKLFNEGKTIIFMSGRPEKYREFTQRWLARNFLNIYYTIIMRKSTDKRQDDETKRDLFNEYFPDKSVIHVVYDDRPRVLRVWRELGLNVVDVGKGVEF
jgi:predicted kinase